MIQGQIGAMAVSTRANLWFGRGAGEWGRLRFPTGESPPRRAESWLKGPRTLPRTPSGSLAAVTLHMRTLENSFLPRPWTRGGFMGLLLCDHYGLRTPVAPMLCLMLP